MLGLMQDWPLTVDKILDHAKEWHGDREIVSRSVEGPIVRTTYAEVHGRAKRLSNALLSLGMKPGDRIATLAWNTARHRRAQGRPGHHPWPRRPPAGGHRPLLHPRP